MDRKHKLNFCIYAREQETADKIISIVNEKNIFYFKKPLLRRFKRRYETETPPYELEQEQIEAAEKQREKRIKYFEKGGK